MIKHLEPFEETDLHLYENLIKEVMEQHDTINEIISLINKYERKDKKC